MKPEYFFVVSRFKEDVLWIFDYCTNNYVVINKGELLPENYKTIPKPNFGGCQYDICEYIFENYDNLPNLIAFMQGNPFDHCNREKFNKIIYNTGFTSLESYEEYVNKNPDPIRKLSEGEDVGYMEQNTSWYIGACNQTFQSRGFAKTCPWENFNQYMYSIFEDYADPGYLRFAPGSQYIVPKENCLFYSKTFWRHMMDLFPKTEGLNGGTEAHVIERSMWYILNNKFKAKF